MKLIIALLFGFISFNCKEGSKTESTSVLVANQGLSSKDTVISTDAVLILIPDSLEIEKAKEANEEDFYTIADDANYYMSEILSKYAKKVDVSNKNVIVFKKENFTFNKSDQNNLWLVIEYHVGQKPVYYNLVDFYSKISNDGVDNNNGNHDNTLTFKNPQIGDVNILWSADRSNNIDSTKISYNNKVIGIVNENQWLNAPVEYEVINCNDNKFVIKLTYLGNSISGKLFTAEVKNNNIEITHIETFSTGQNNMEGCTDSFNFKSNYYTVTTQPGEGNCKIIKENSYCTQ